MRYADKVLYDRPVDGGPSRDMKISKPSLKDKLAAAVNPEYLCTWHLGEAIFWSTLNMEDFAKLHRQHHVDFLSDSPGDIKITPRVFFTILELSLSHFYHNVRGKDVLDIFGGIEFLSSQKLLAVIGFIQGADAQYLSRLMRRVTKGLGVSAKDWEIQPRNSSHAKHIGEDFREKAFRMRYPMQYAICKDFRILYALKGLTQDAIRKKSGVSSGSLWRILSFRCQNIEIILSALEGLSISLDDIKAIEPDHDISPWTKAVLCESVNDQQGALRWRLQAQGLY